MDKAALSQTGADGSAHFLCHVLCHRPCCDLLSLWAWAHNADLWPFRATYARDGCGWQLRTPEGAGERHPFSALGDYARPLRQGNVVLIISQELL